jgi:hypothetical protein
MLLQEARQAGVELIMNCETLSVRHNAGEWVKDDNDRSERDVAARPGAEGGFHLDTSLGSFACETLVVASGGLSIPSLGGSGIGYELAERFGLRLLPRSAGLVPFTFTDAMHAVCGRLSGISTDAVLYNDRRSFREHILFTHRGLSGPAALQLSSYWAPGETIQASLLPDHRAMERLLDWKQQHPRTVLRTQLVHLLPRKLVLELEAAWWPELADTPLAEWPNVWLEAVAQKLESWTLKPAGTEGYRTAEVTLGGVDTRELSSKTMESVIPGLFFIGEVVDVTGHLGGFNFQWAWSSGFVAGQAV